MSIGWSLRSFRACLSNLPLSPHKHISFASLISAHWILGYAHTRAMQISIGVGVIVDYLAGLRLWLAHYGDRAEDGR